jgi:hypothetical protein
MPQPPMESGIIRGALLKVFTSLAPVKRPMKTSVDFRLLNLRRCEERVSREVFVRSRRLSQNQRGGDPPQFARDAAIVQDLITQEVHSTLIGGWQPQERDRQKID